MVKPERIPRDFTELRNAILEERAALLSGEIEKLEGFSEMKRILAARLASARTGLSAPYRAELLDLARHNQSLLSAAAQGIRSALRQVERFQGTAAGGATYAQDGTRTEMTRHSIRHDHRS